MTGNLVPFSAYLRKGAAAVNKLNLDAGDKLKHNLPHSMHVLNARTSPPLQ
jgi:hypothetical protein